MTSPTNGKFAVSLSIASAARILSLSKTGGRPPLRPRFLAAAKKPGSGVFDDQFTLKLIERGGDVEEQSPLGRASVDVAGQHPECLFLLLKVVIAPRRRPNRLGNKARAIRG
jgi:hypothetical protein